MWFIIIIFNNKKADFLSHDNLWLKNAWYELFRRQNHSTIAVDFVAYVNIFPEDSHVNHTGPSTDGWVPANDATGDASMLLDAHSTHHTAARESQG